MMTAEHIGQMKRAELLSSLGAGVLGAGVALLLPDLLANYTFSILLLGEITTRARIHYDELVRRVIPEIDYDSSDKGFDGHT